MVARRRYTPRERAKVAYEQRYACAGCAVLLPPDWQLDHIVPLSEGGGNERANVQALCVACHADKTARASAARGTAGSRGARGAARRARRSPLMALARRLLAALSLLRARRR
jgi:5-methylcytosine-specific restriction endonuclease McrA